MPVKNPPEGKTAVTPYITVSDAAKAIDFYKEVFGAEERFRMNTPDGKVMHADISIGGASVMLHDAMPDKGAPAPEMGKPLPVMMYVYVSNADSVVNKAVEAGAKLMMPVQDFFYGDRAGLVSDPFGHKWWIATHVEDVAPAELERRGKAETEKMKKAS